MSADEDVISPPYPGVGTAVQGLYGFLVRLHAWVSTYHESHSTMNGQAVIPTLKPLTKKATYIAQPIVTHMTHLMLMRRVREQWDHLIRCYESDWDDESCVRQRVLLLVTCVTMLNSSGSLFEHREMQKQNELESCQKTVESVAEFMRKLMETQSYDEEVENG